MLSAWLLVSAMLLQTPSTSPAAQTADSASEVPSAQKTQLPANISSAVTAEARVEKERGDNLAAEGKMDEAILAYQNAVKLSPGYVDAYNQLGVALVKAGKTEESVTVFDKALAIDSGYATALYNRGFALKKLGKTDEVVQSFSRYVELMPEEAAGYFQLAEGLYVQGTFDKALANYEKFIAKSGTEKTKKTEHAERRIEELKKKLAGGNQDEAALPAAEVKKKENAHPEKSVLFVTPERESLCKSKIAEGMSLRSEGRNREAVFSHQDAVNANPEDAEAIYQLAESYAAMDFLYQAAVRFEKVVQSDKGTVTLKSQAKDRLASIYKEMERRGMARDGTFSGAAKSTGGPGEIMTPAGKPIDPQARAASMKGASLFADGKYAEAVEQYDIALAHHPDVGEFYSARASAWLASGATDRALADFTKANQYKPELAIPHYGMGECFMAKELFPQARLHFENFLKSTGADATEELRNKARQRIQQLDQKKAGGPSLKFQK